MKPNDLNIPDWVRFIAQDRDGTWWGYQVEPLHNHHGWYENEVGRSVRLGSDEPNEGWRDSLRAIESAN